MAVSLFVISFAVAAERGFAVHSYASVGPVQPEFTVITAASSTGRFVHVHVHRNVPTSAFSSCGTSLHHVSVTSGLPDTVSDVQVGFVWFAEAHLLLLPAYMLPHNDQRTFVRLICLIPYSCARFPC